MSLRRGLLLALSLSLWFVAPTFPQTQPSAAPPQVHEDPAKLFHVEFPDSASGLEKLAKEMLKAQKDGDATRAAALAQSLVLPDAPAWYSEVFGEYTATHEGLVYEQNRKNLPDEILALFTRVLQEKYTSIAARRFDSSCDDDAGENTFSLLQQRLEPLPLYELRFFNGVRFYRLWALAYVDGAFRFIKTPDVAAYIPPTKKPAPVRDTRIASTVGGAEKDDSTDGKKESADRLRTGDKVTASKIIRKIQPSYPEIARREHLQGTVRLHAIIGKDGAIAQLKVMKGYCSLAQAAIEAVKGWRYTPTLLAGQPVEVDTTIDVIFSLSSR